MTRRVMLYVLLLPALSLSLTAQADITAIGPPVGAQVPDFRGVDQFGATHTLQSSVGPKGGMLVFFRSADW